MGVPQGREAGGHLPISQWPPQPQGSQGFLCRPSSAPSGQAAVSSSWGSVGTVLGGAAGVLCLFANLRSLTKQIFILLGRMGL